MSAPYGAATGCDVIMGRFLLIVSVIIGGLLLLRYWQQQGRGRGQRPTHSRKNAPSNNKPKDGRKLVQDPKTGEYRPERDDDDDNN